MRYQAINLELDLDVDTGRQVEAHERVDGTGRGIEDVNETLVSAHLELLTGVLVHVGRTDDRVQVALGRQRDGAGNASTGLLSGLNDELGGLIDDLVIIAFRRILIFWLDNLTSNNG